ncbi:hypothetical protein POM88_050903 [Heracleum sosnowskyi]|uniref:C3H1-type domain-containing protein n=1 Tax=Heracleum sosnowskyi TaxID=360622 RepID=A0AAD8M2Y3_9APIA|nr:hypothetical protein POM88_050903 [Heracleum sosnowskyi]
MISSRLQGTFCMNPEQGRHSHIPQLEWKCPPKLTLDPDWRVAAGEESTEAVIQRRVPTDPRLHAASLREASDHSDSRTPEIPIIPIEEEGDLLNNSSSAFLTTAAGMEGETMSLVNKALNALNGVALRQGEPPIGMGLFMQWLNSDYVRRFLSGQSSPRIEPASMPNDPTQSVAESSLPLMVTASNKMSSFNDVEPLVEVTMAPMSPLYSSPSASWVSNMKTERIVDEYGTFIGKIMEPIPSWKSITSPVVSLSLPQTNQLSEFPRASLQPTADGLASLPYRNPSIPEMHLHSVLGTTAPIPVPRTNLLTSMGSGPSLRTDFVTLLKANQHPAANKIHPATNMIHLPPAFGPPNPLINSSSLHGNPQIVGHGQCPLKLHQNPCMNITASNNTISFNDDIALPEATMAPMSPLSLPQTELTELPRASLQSTTNELASLLHWNPPLPEMHSILGKTALLPVPRTKLVTSLGPGPSLRTDFITLPKAMQHPAANVIHLPPAFGPSTPLVNSLSLHGNPQILGQGPSPLKRCMYFSTPRGCRNGATCPYLHSKSD